ncbi:hypothetical protein D3C83_84180 [compost metagenome]
MPKVATTPIEGHAGSNSMLKLWNSTRPAPISTTTSPKARWMPCSAESRGTNATRMNPQSSSAAASMRGAIAGRESEMPFIRFSITCAWISTPGTNCPSGVVL